MICLSGLIALCLSFSARAAAVEPNSALEQRVETFEAAWNIINESYVNPTFHGIDWGAVREELLPKAQATQTTPELRTVIEEMLHRLGDSHMALIPGDVARPLEAIAAQEPPHPDPAPGTGDSNTNRTDAASAGGAEAREGGFGMEIRILDRRVVVARLDPEGAAAKEGVKTGWVLQSMGAETVDQLLEPVSDELGGSRGQFLAWGLITSKLMGRPGSTLRIEFLDGADQPVALTLRRQHVSGEGAKLGFLPTMYAHLEAEKLATPQGAKVGLIRFNLWMVPVIAALDASIDRFRQADGIVLDLRGNVGGLGGMILGVSGHFLDDRISLGTLKMRGSELKFFSNPRRVNAHGDRVEPYGGPVAILVDSLSLSAAEIFAGGMQDIGRARVFGETTGGQALPAIWDRLPNGDVLYHAFGDFVTASGIRLEGRGVIPDERVALNRQDLLIHRDAPVLAALRWIDQQKAKRVPAKEPASGTRQD